MSNNTPEAETNRALRETTTQFNTQKTAEEDVVWNVDSSRDLTRQRNVWRSNGTLFDTSLFTDTEASEVINLVAGGDTARLKSAFVGRYISHALAEPGLAISVADANVQIDGDNEVSLDHGLVQFGPFFHDGSDITDGFGLELDASGLRFRVVAGGQDMGDSPIPQSEFNVDRVHGDEGAYDASIQTVFNFGYGFYNALPLTVQRVVQQTKLEDRRVRQETLHSENPGEGPILDTPHFPVQVFASNEGVGDALDVTVGGMQFARYGAGDPNFRTTTDWRTTNTAPFTSSTSGSPDPANVPGDPIFAYQREADSYDLTLRDKEVIIDPTADIYLHFWDEWDPETALDGAFDNPDGLATDGDTDKESNILTNASCTNYTPTVYNFRGNRRVDSGQKNEVDPTDETVEDRVPQEATRVVTAVIRDGSQDFDLSFLEYEIEEGY